MKRIVIVDDSPVARKTVVHSLSGYYDVREVANPYELPLLMRELQPDLVLVDVGFASLSGDRLVMQLRKRHHCPLVLYSARGAKELAVLARECGAAGYICKTGDPEELLGAVQKFLPAAGEPARSS